ncbi:hypothetical protein [Kibdelosporangium philippinense]|uniref:hypothetical protein n=1 Tax=Kibdelosporangium philippinense TaxID=211113 RepID=UPI003609D7E1
MALPPRSTAMWSAQAPGVDGPRRHSRNPRAGLEIGWWDSLCDPTGPFWWTDGSHPVSF